MFFSSCHVFFMNEWLVKNKAATAPITFEETVMVMINWVEQIAKRWEKKNKTFVTSM